MKIKPENGGNWITTKSGRKFDFANPSPEMLIITDIAGALSKICRFGGHGRQFYSVAQHCVNVSVCTALLGGDPLAGLLHDAQEAYIGDMVTPLKALLPGYQDIEAKIVECIRQKWGVDIHDYHVMASDKTMLWEEALLLVPGVREWPAYRDRPMTPQNKSLKKSIYPALSSEDAEDRFLMTFRLARKASTAMARRLGK